MTSNPNANPDEYELAIDGQTEKFLDIKQKLTYFLITAAVAVAIFTLQAAGRDPISGWIFKVLIIFMGISALGSAGCALANIYCEVLSYRKHIANRYKRLNWDSLPEKEKKQWDRLNHYAREFFSFSVLFLLLQIMATITFFVIRVITNVPILPNKL